jgi:hypothetical protein
VSILAIPALKLPAFEARYVIDKSRHLGKLSNLFPLC